jgi:two-component system sensor histidine kinase KdpD
MPIIEEVFRTPSRKARVVAYLLSIGIIAVCAEGLFAIPAITPGAAAPVLLLAVLLIARQFGTGPALVASVGAALAFSFYFLPPVGLFIEDLNDWVAFGTFTATALVVGELAARAERRQQELEEGKREIEQLYQQLGAAFERASEAEAARRNEQLKSALLDALTHNLRTPLTAIKASVTALLSSGEIDAGALSSDSRRDLLAVIDEESDRLNLFIEGLTLADRPDPAQPNTMRTIRADLVVREAVARAETVARRHRVVVSVAPNLPPLVVDRSAIGEALYILLDNASKYSPVNTTIRVTASVADEHHVRIAVEDEGPGIAPDLREQVFQKFFRIPGRESVDPRRTGIGLGLPIARRLVESQAGQIGIETPASGRGTTVALTLPCAARDVDEETGPVPAEPALRA